jgi:hypothetical protein
MVSGVLFGPGMQCMRTYRLPTRARHQRTMTIRREPPGSPGMIDGQDRCADVIRSARFYPSGIRIKVRFTRQEEALAICRRRNAIATHSFHAGCAPAVGAFQWARLSASPSPRPPTPCHQLTGRPARLAGHAPMVRQLPPSDDPLPHLCENHAAAYAHDAAFPIDRLMALIARTARQPIAVAQRCPPGDGANAAHSAARTRCGIRTRP